MRTKIHQDGSELTIERIQDVEPIIENNKRLKNTPQRSDMMRHIASIPNVIIEQWLAEEQRRGNKTIRWGSKELDALIKRKLQDHDYLFLRTDK